MPTLIFDSTLHAFTALNRDLESSVTLRKVLNLLVRFPECTLAGGALRDLLAGTSPKDFDVWIPKNVWSKVMETLPSDVRKDDSFEYQGIHFVIYDSTTILQPKDIPLKFDYFGNMVSLSWVTTTEVACAGSTVVKHETSPKFRLRYHEKAVVDIFGRQLTWSGHWPVNEKAQRRHEDFCARGWEMKPNVLPESKPEQKDDSSPLTYSSYTLKPSRGSLLASRLDYFDEL